MIYILCVTLILIFNYLIAKLKVEQILAGALGLAGIIITFIILIIYVSQPKAMYVYQGKTTLEITYRDGVAVDSCVVFKNK